MLIYTVNLDIESGTEILTAYFILPQLTQMPTVCSIEFSFKQVHVKFTINAKSFVSSERYLTSFRRALLRHTSTIIFSCGFFNCTLFPIYCQFIPYWLFYLYLYVYMSFAITRIVVHCLNLRNSEFTAQIKILKFSINNPRLEE